MYIWSELADERILSVSPSFSVTVSSKQIINKSSKMCYRYKKAEKGHKQTWNESKINYKMVEFVSM